MTAFLARDTTFCRYLAVLFESGLVRGGPVWPYIAAVVKKYKRDGARDPSNLYIVEAVNAGYRKYDSNRRNGRPKPRSAPFLATYARKGVEICVTSSGTEEVI